MEIKTAPTGPFGTNMYVVIDDAGTSCVIIDVPPNSEEILVPFLKKNKISPEAILITHGHWDHNGGVAEILKEFPCKVFAHEESREFHEHPEKFAPWYKAAIPGLGDKDFQAFQLSRPTSGGDEFSLLGKKWKALYVPGHCPGSLAFYCPEEKIVFTGDALFAGSIGRTDLPGGNFKALEQSILENLFTLPKDVRVFPGHGPDTTIRDEIDSNPYVRMR